MKKIIALFMVMAVCVLSLCGCGKTEDYSKYAFTDVTWTRSTDADTEYITFYGDGSFSYYCACGNPVNDSDLCERYTYNDDTKTIKLDYTEKTAETITKIIIKKCNEDELVLDFEGDIRTFVKEDADEEYETPDSINFDGITYTLLKYNADIFCYDLAEGFEYEEDTYYPLPHDKWEMVYYNGDLFVLDGILEEATSYYADDKNFVWSIEIDDPDLEEAKNYPLSLNAEEISYLYGMEDMEKDKTLHFDDIEVFGTLKKTSKDGLICATIQLAFLDGNWYWRSEIIDESEEDFPEFVFELPKSLNKQIANLT